MISCNCLLSSPVTYTEIGWLERFMATFTGSCRSSLTHFMSLASFCRGCRKIPMTWNGLTWFCIRGGKYQESMVNLQIFLPCATLHLKKICYLKSKIKNFIKNQISNLMKRSKYSFIFFFKENINFSTVKIEKIKARGN